MAYEMRECVLEDVPPPNTHMAAYAPDGGYIGLEDVAQMLEERGIQAQRVSTEFTVCSIGFCESEQKWYGWSHRAMHGFGIGSTVTKGDCAYQPKDQDDLISEALAFWRDPEFKESIWAEDPTEHEGERGVWIRWKYNEQAPNAAIRGETHGAFMPFPAKYGRGEWTAQTLEDAKQMAIDYADGVG